MKQDTKYGLECVLCFYMSFFHIVVLLFDIPPSLIKFLERVVVELFRLFSKPFSHHSLNFFITCERNSFETFHKNCKQPEVSWCQIWAVGTVWYNFRSDALYGCWSGSISVGSGISMLKNISFFCTKCNWLVVSTFQGSLHKSWSWFS